MNWNSPATTFEPHPEGNFFAVCVDVYDKEEKNNFYNQVDTKTGKMDTRETIRVAYIEFFTSEGETARFKANATLGKPDKQSNLRKFLKNWNAKITDAHFENFNPENVLGWPAYITVAHRESKGRVYANVTGAMAPPPNSPVPTIPVDYVRYKDRGTAQPVATNAAAPATTTGEMPIQGQDEGDLQF